MFDFLKNKKNGNTVSNGKNSVETKKADLNEKFASEKSKYPFTITSKRVPGGSSWADAMISHSCDTKTYILHNCNSLQREFAEKNAVMEKIILEQETFCISINGAEAFKGTFAFVEHCRETSSTAFKDIIHQHCNKALQELKTSL